MGCLCSPQGVSCQPSLHPGSFEPWSQDLWLVCYSQPHVSLYSGTHHVLSTAPFPTAAAWGAHTSTICQFCSSSSFSSFNSCLFFAFRFYDLPPSLCLLKKPQPLCLVTLSPSPSLIPLNSLQPHMEMGPRVSCQEVFVLFVPSNRFGQISFWIAFFCNQYLSPFIFLHHSASTFLLRPTVKPESQRYGSGLPLINQVNSNSLHSYHISWELPSSLLLLMLYTDLWIKQLSYWNKTSVQQNVYQHIFNAYTNIHMRYSFIQKGESATIFKKY